MRLGVIAVVCFSTVFGLAQAAQTDGGMHATRRAPEAVQGPAEGGAVYYIVRLQDAPAATYTGGVPGYAATNPHYRGERMLDVGVADSYASYLDSRQSELLDAGGRALGHALSPRFRYHYALNGMSLKLTSAEAERLAAMPGVLSVQPVRHFAPDAVGIPAAAGDTNASRGWVNAPIAWQLPTFNATDNEGEGIVAAVLDTGVNHANSSFAGTGALDGYVAKDPAGLRFGVCDTANTAQHSLSTPLNCNNKLIGAYSYTHGSNDPDSPEDSEGHGSHTASTIVGDFTSTPVNGVSTPLSGVAPHASLIVYDVCDPTDQCSTDQSVAAVEQAIQDQARLKSKWGSAFKGMVLNFSIGGTNDPYSDPVEQAFLSAEEAGIYVSAAGGNGGPANVVSHDPVNAPVYPVQHLGPWLATLAAATHSGTFSGDLLENFSGGDTATQPAANMSGVGDTAGFGPADLVYSGNFTDGPVLTGDAPTSGLPYPASLGASENAKQCIYPFPAHKFSGTEIVVCDRGTIPLVDKAYNVMKGGAKGMVIATTSSSSQDLVVESYVIPATLIDLTDGDALRAWINASSGNPTPAQAQISGSTLTVDPAQADQLAGFSSRGPNNNNFDDVIKPDLSAPGVSVLAALSDPQYTQGCSGCGPQAETYGLLDGTSMAAPHDTGVAALLKQAHPSWTPAEIKSALMLTAVTSANGVSPGVSDQCARLDSGDNCVASTALPSPQARGAGRIDLDAADRAGLMLDESGANYSAADPSKGGDLTTLNLASLGNAACAPSCSWTRNLTSTFTSAAPTYTVTVSGLTSGLKMKVSPSSFTLMAGHTQRLTVTADAGGVPANKWAFGEVDLSTTDAGDAAVAIPAMHLPLAVKSVLPSPHMSITPTSLDYPVASGASASHSFVISNNGQKPLSWSTIVNGGPGNGSLDCSNHGMAGLSLSQSNGSVAPGGSTSVTATFKAGGIGAGTYNGVICVEGNASDHPLIALSVVATISGRPSGGGGLGLFGLAALILTVLRRKIH